MFDPSKRIVIESYAGFFDDELDSLIEEIKTKIKELDITKRLKKTIVVKVDCDPFYADEEEENES